MGGTSRFGGFGIQLALSESYLAVTTTVAPRNTRVYKKDASGELPTDPFAAVVAADSITESHYSGYTEKLWLSDNRMIISYHYRHYMGSNNYENGGAVLMYESNK